jgi:hypothetical protein
LKELRADARKQAVVAAREKAELYCREAGVAVGKVIAIEDSNPDQLTRIFHRPSIVWLSRQFWLIERRAGLLCAQHDRYPSVCHVSLVHGASAPGVDGGCVFIR